MKESTRPNILLILGDRLPRHAIAGWTICRMPNVQKAGFRC
jgi:hypothetical protein